MQVAPLTLADRAGLLFGTNAPHPRQVVKAACDGMGWGRIVSRPPSLHAALLAACGEVAKPLLRQRNMPLVVRALDRDLAFEAARIRRGHSRNDTIHLFSCELSPDGSRLSLLNQAPELDAAALHQSLEAEYLLRRDNLSAGQVRTVVRSVIRKLQGVELQGRCVYFLPQHRLEAWHQWQVASRLQNYHVVHFEVARDPATIQHVLGALNLEVAAQSREIHEALLNDALTSRHARTLRKRAEALIEKIRSYERALGQPLDWMKEPLEQAAQSVAVCDLLAVSA